MGHKNRGSWIGLVTPESSWSLVLALNSMGQCKAFLGGTQEHCSFAGFVYIYLLTALGLSCGTWMFGLRRGVWKLVP